MSALEVKWLLHNYHRVCSWVKSAHLEERNLLQIEFFSGFNARSQNNAQNKVCSWIWSKLYSVLEANSASGLEQIQLKIWSEFISEVRAPSNQYPDWVLFWIQCEIWSPIRSTSAQDWERYSALDFEAHSVQENEHILLQVWSEFCSEIITFLFFLFQVDSVHS